MVTIVILNRGRRPPEPAVAAPPPPLRSSLLMRRQTHSPPRPGRCFQVRSRLPAGLRLRQKLPGTTASPQARLSCAASPRDCSNTRRTSKTVFDVSNTTHFAICTRNYDAVEQVHRFAQTHKRWRLHLQGKLSFNLLASIMIQRKV